MHRELYQQGLSGLTTISDRNLDYTLTCPWQNVCGWPQFARRSVLFGCVVNLLFLCTQSHKL